jgi:hypothetical protein
MLAGMVSVMLIVPGGAQLARISVDNLTNTDSVHKT